MQTTIENLTKADLTVELQDRLLTVLDWIGQTAKSGMEIASKELPIMLREIAIYGAVYNWAIVLLTVVSMIGLFVLLRNKHNRPWSTDYSAPTGRVFFAITMWFFSLIGFGCCTAGNAFDDAIKATFAPRIYAIEWTMDQVKKLNSPQYPR